MSGPVLVYVSVVIVSLLNSTSPVPLPIQVLPEPDGVSERTITALITKSCFVRSTDALRGATDRSYQTVSNRGLAATPTHYCRQLPTEVADTRGNAHVPIVGQIH